MLPNRWKAKFFPMDYTTEPEHVRFTLDGLKTPAGKLGVWRSHFRGVSESVDPGAYANASSNTSFLVREGDAALASSGFTVAVGRNEIVTVSTQVQGVPSIAPTLPTSPPACPFPRTLADDFDAAAPGQEAKFFQDMHGSFEAVRSSDASRQSRRCGARTSNPSLQRSRIYTTSSGSTHTQCVS